MDAQTFDHIIEQKGYRAKIHSKHRNISMNMFIMMVKTIKMMMMMMMMAFKCISFKVVWLRSWRSASDTCCVGMMNANLIKSSYIINSSIVKSCLRRSGPVCVKISSYAAKETLEISETDSSTFFLHPFPRPWLQCACVIEADRDSV